MEIRIENSLELLTQDEWDKYLAVDFFDNMSIEPSEFDIGKDLVNNFIKNLKHPLLGDLIFFHNNKVCGLQFYK